MTNEQKAEFEKRRLSVMRTHATKDPKLRQIRRKRKRTVVLSVLGSLGVLAIALVLIKSFMLVLEGPEGYARIVAPMLHGQAEDAVLVRAIGPDPVSTEISGLLRPFFSDRTQSTPSEGVTVPLNLSSAEIDPPSETASTP